MFAFPSLCDLCFQGNVKLREGAKLLDLPGKPNKKNKRRRNKRDPPPAETSKGGENSEKNAPEERQPLEPPGGSPLKAASRSVVVPQKQEVAAKDKEMEPEQPPPPRRSSSWFFWSSAADTDKRSEAAPTETEKQLSDQDELNPLEGYLGNSQHRLDLESAETEENAMDINEQQQEETVEILESEEDDDEEEGIPLILRLGKFGRIGTLDVRLVGKDIHVFVEDADLTVEAVRLAPDVETDDKDADPDAKKKKKPKKAPPEIKTVGDRVLAENAIARAISLIPNLFLRDIRVRVVLRDEGEPVAPRPREDEDEGGEDGGHAGGHDVVGARHHLQQLN